MWPVFSLVSVLGQIYSPDDKDSSKELPDGKSFSKNQPAHDRRENRDKVDIGRRNICRQMLDAVIVKAVGTKGNHRAKVNDRDSRADMPLLGEPG